MEVTVTQHLRQACNMTCKNSDFRRISYWKGAQGDVAAKFHINFKQDLLPSRGSNRKAECFKFVAVSKVPPCEAFLLSHPTTLKAQTACAAQGPWQFPKLAITQPLYALLTDVVIERKRSGPRCKYLLD